MNRRTFGTGLLAGAVVFWARGAIGAGDDARAAAGEERAGLLQQGEAALSRGETAQALRLFERASAMLHAADSEMGLVRASMQSGAYRRALTLAAHAAGAHREVPAGSVLYAWLLHAGGQAAFAQRVLDKVETRAPADALVAQARAQLRSPTPQATGALLSAPWRVAPFDVGGPLPATARVTGTGVLLEGGRRALAPWAAAGEARALWVRDGLGRRTIAQLERRAEDIGLVLLRLEEPVDAAGLTLASRDPFAGSPAFAIDYTITPAPEAAWPVLRTGLVGAADTNGLVALSVAGRAGTQGGVVLDAGARVLGIALPTPDGRERLLPVSTLRRELGELGGASANPTISPRVAVDGVYESALPAILQVIAEP